MNPAQPKPDVLRTMAAFNPVRAEVAVSATELERAMAIAIRRGEGQPVGTVRSRPRLRTALGVGVSLACVGVIAAVILLTGGSASHPERPAYAAAAVKVADANPRILVTAPGWKITSANQFEPTDGEIQFSDGDHKLDMTWYPAKLYGEYLEDRAEVSPPETSTLLGHTATTVYYGHRGGYATMFSPFGRIFIEIRAFVDDRHTYDEILSSLQQVDVDTWLAAMPPQVVQPSEHAAVVDEFLKGVPIPPGFDVEALRDDSAVGDRLAIANKVISAVACDWLDRWAAATKSGDAAAAREASEAMATSHEWPVLHDFPPGRIRAQAIWQYADQIQHGRLDTSFGGVVVVEEDGTKYEYGPAYANALGCNSLRKREVN